jgi:hypothetical protein
MRESPGLCSSGDDGGIGKRGENRVYSLNSVETQDEGERQSLIDGITNYTYTENIPTLATPSYTDFEQPTSTNSTHEFFIY